MRLELEQNSLGGIEGVLGLPALIPRPVAKIESAGVLFLFLPF